MSEEIVIVPRKLFYRFFRFWLEHHRCHDGECVETIKAAHNILRCHTGEVRR